MLLDLSSQMCDFISTEVANFYHIISAVLFWNNCIAYFKFICPIYEIFRV